MQGSNGRTVEPMRATNSAQRGAVTRGMPTSYAASPLNAEIAPGDELPPVWPWPEGYTRGVALEPL
jgi:hypothetical protein